MNYLKIYNDLINSSKARTLNKQGYVEKHHIKPKCMGGSDCSENITILTAREHFIAHQLLYKAYIHTEYAHSLLKAIIIMRASSHGQIRNNRLYEWIKIKQSEHMKEWIKDNHPKGMLGKSHSEKIKRQISETTKLKARSLAKNVYAYNLDGELIHEFTSLSDAKESLFPNINSSIPNIAKAIKNPTRKYKNYLWRNKKYDNIDKYIKPKMVWYYNAKNPKETKKINVNNPKHNIPNGWIKGWGRYK